MTFLTEKERGLSGDIVPVPFWAAAAAVLSLLCYLPALGNGFVNWDDHIYVVDSEKIRSIGPELVSWAFTTFQNGNWHPLTLLSYALDYFFYGLNPSGYHFTNVFLHSLCVFVLVLLCSRLLEVSARADARLRVFPAFLSGLLFGIHPLHVESVVWISERKDLLCGLFYFTGLLFYLSYRLGGGWKDGRRSFYFLSLGAFILALLSKPMAVTFPVVLLIIDSVIFRNSGPQKSSPIKALLTEKLPFFVFSLAGGLLAFPAQSHAVGSLTDYPLGIRLINSVQSYLFYLKKLVFPVSLSPFYPYMKDDFPFSFDTLLALFLLSGATVFCFKQWRKDNRLWGGIWAYYVLTILPVIGIVQVGEQSAADRYAYIPTAIFFLPVSYAISGLYAGTTKRIRIAIPVILVFICAALSFSSVRICRIWTDSLTMWNRVINLYPGKTHFSYEGRGMALLDTGDYKAALSDCSVAAGLKKDSVKAYHCIAEAAFKLKDYETSIGAYDRILEADPADSFSIRNRAITYIFAGRYVLAEREFEKLVLLNPDSSDPYYDLAALYAIQGNAEEACIWLGRAFEKGFADLPRLSADADFARIKNAPCYRSLVKPRSLSVDAH